jgi:hypothetical protein
MDIDAMYSNLSPTTEQLGAFALFKAVAAELHRQVLAETPIGAEQAEALYHIRMAVRSAVEAIMVDDPRLL